VIMLDSTQVQPGKDQTRYARLDRLLLYLLAAELGYFVLLVFAGVVVAILAYATDLLPDASRYATSIFWPVLAYLLAMPLNVAGAFASIVLNIRSKHQGYPGTGHLLNWTFVMTTGWLAIAAIAFALSLAAGGYD